MSPQTRGVGRCRWLPLAALAGLVLFLALAPAWAGPARSGHAKARPVVEGSEQDTSLPDLVSDPKPLPTKSRPKPVADEAPLPLTARGDTGLALRDTRGLGGSPAASPPERVSALDIAGKLLAVLLCVYGLFTGLRLFKTGNLAWPHLPRADAPAAQLRLIEALPLGGNRRVYLVQAGGRTLLIGADASGLAALGEVSPPLPGPRTAPPVPSDDAISPDDTGEIAPAMTRRAETRTTLVSPLRPLGGRSQSAAALGGAQVERGAHVERGEEDWARKRDLLIRALKEKAVG